MDADGPTPTLLADNPPPVMGCGLVSDCTGSRRAPGKLPCSQERASIYAPPVRSHFSHIRIR
jgi:hypothetical protein